MTIKETVKQALTKIRGNKAYDLNDIQYVINSGNGVAYQPEHPSFLKSDQIRRALRDIPYVRKLADGRYVVKGRRVPPKPLVAPAIQDPAKNGPLTLEALHALPFGLT